MGVSSVILVIIMMFNGFLLGSDSDTSDFYKEATRACSGAESVSGAEWARTLEEKLNATLLVLKNKEETVRVQAESLALAEERIRDLTDLTSHHLNSTHPRPAETCDVSVSAHGKGMEQEMLETLRDNLSVIEELYRECFYESAKQDQLIEMLRRSHVELRSADRQKTQYSGQRCGVVHQHQRSCQHYQDIASEMDNLKAAVSNLLNNSNNDSGVWEQQGGGSELHEDLVNVDQQLRRLHQLLTMDDSMCGLSDENVRYKEKNKLLESQLLEAQVRVQEMEAGMSKSTEVEHQYQKQLKEMEKELDFLRDQMSVTQKRDACTCEAYSLQLQQVQVLLNDKTEELAKAEAKCEHQQAQINELNKRLREAETVIKEKNTLNEEVVRVSSQVSAYRDQLQQCRQTLERELTHAAHTASHLAHHCRDKAEFTNDLQNQLEEAQAKGAALCEETKRIVCDVRRCIRRQRQRQREQEYKIKEQEILIKSLQESRLDTEHRDPCCSRYFNQMGRYARESENSSCTRCPSRSVDRLEKTSASEMAGGMTPPTPPPRRLLRKKPLCTEMYRNDALPSTSHMQRQESNANARPESPTQQLIERVEVAHRALAHAHARWERRGPLRGHTHC
ncbi:golgin subfamily A member 6-like protein 22 isoform X2 [Leptidea sinapis]|uniref:golgin subfamily A member 6-like protein 22 isoform X2 n=1 Tax=Leptidea sinapis TaxID=189913 RepID=UPI0021C3DAFE|nr:golgin subfamily A member 6-like protein 22 isoform X2 [Leptidea sinapis]